MLKFSSTLEKAGERFRWQGFLATGVRQERREGVLQGGNIPHPCLFGQVCGNANLIASIYLYMEAGSTLERFFAHFLCDKESGGHAA